jgi:hypothetical protein
MRGAKKDSKRGARKGKLVKLSPEDRVRMTRLYEEMLSRLREMNLIVSRNLNKPMPTSTEDLETALSSSGGGGPSFPRVEGRPNTYKVDGGCYDFDQGLCYPC